MLLLFGGLIYVAIEEGDRFSHYAINAHNVAQGDPFSLFLQFIQDNIHHPLSTLLIQIIAVLVMVRLFGYLSGGTDTFHVCHRYGAGFQCAEK